MLAGALRRATQRVRRDERAVVAGVKVDRAKGASAPLCALVVAGLVAPALAGAVWTTPQDISAAGQNASNSQVAVDADGDTVFVWQGSDGTNTRIQTRARSAGGALSPVQTISPAGENASAPQVAVDADGDAVFTWTRFDGAYNRVQARARSAAGTLSAVQTLSPAGRGAFQAEVAVDGDGDAVFTWTRFDGANYRIQTRARSAGGTLSAVQTLSGAGRNAFGVTGPQVAVDADGDAVFIWERDDGTDNRVQARARSAAGVLSPVQTLSAAGADGTSPQVAVDADGDAIFTWARAIAGGFRIQTRARTGFGALSAVQDLNVTGQYGARPQVAVDADGDAVFTWLRFDSALVYAVQARARSAAGNLGTLQTLSPSGNITAIPEVAVDTDGDAVFTWQHSDGTNTRTQARARSAGGTLSAVQTLSGAGQNAVGTQVAVDAGGDAIVTWQRSDGTSQRVQASVGP